MPPEHPSRRTVLRTLGVVGVAGLGGAGLTAADAGDASTEPAGAWPQFHAGGAHTGAVDAGGPTANYLEARWRVEESSVSNPAVVDGTVYVTDQRRVLAYDAATGDTAWTRVLDSATGYASAYANNSVAVADGRVFVASDGGVVALDAATGDREWLVGHGTRVSPAVADGSVYAAAAREGEGSHPDVLFSLATSDGSEEWRFDPTDAITSPPAVADGTVYLGTESGVYAVDAGTGEELWNRQYLAVATWTTPTVVDGTVYAQGSSGVGGTSVVAALDAGTGEVRWDASPGRFPDLPSDGDVDDLSPAVHDGRVFVTVVRPDEAEREDDDPRSLVALDAETGTEQWRFGSEARSVTSAPVVAGDTVYVGGDGAENGYALFALDAATGTEVTRFWRDDGFDAPVVGPPSVVDGTVFAATYSPTVDAGIFALEPGGEPPEAPPDPELAVVEDTTGACTPVTFEVSFPDRPTTDARRFLYRWDFEDGGFETETSTGEASWTYEPGDHGARVVVENQYGATREATTTVAVEECDGEPAAPEPVVDVLTDDPVVDEPVAFEGSVANRPDGTVSYRWAFGDGRLTSAPDPTHAYDGQGTYTVRLTVFDAEGREGETTTTVTVDCEDG